MRKKRRNKTRQQLDLLDGAGRRMGKFMPLWRRLRVWAKCVLVSVYVVLLIVVPPAWLDPSVRSVWRGPQLWVHGMIGDVLSTLGVEGASIFVRAGIYYIVLLLLVPAIYCFLIGRWRLSDTGWRKPNQLLLRIVGCSFIVSLPFLVWMVNSEEFAPYYRSYLDAGPSIILVYYLVVLFCEHFFFGGVLLAVFRDDGRWPGAPSLDRESCKGWRRIAQWFGIAQPTGLTTGLERFARWLGIPSGCIGAIVLSGVLFGLVHAGKSGREFLLAFPGGIFLAALAYRCNSWHAPYLLHAGTVTAAVVMLLLMQS